MKILNWLRRVYVLFPFAATENKGQSLAYLIQAHKGYHDAAAEKERLEREKYTAN